MYQLNTVYLTISQYYMYLTLLTASALCCGKQLPIAGKEAIQLSPLYGISFLARANCIWGDFWAKLGLFLFSLSLNPGRYGNSDSHHYLQIRFKWASSFGIAGRALWFSVHDMTESLNTWVCHLNSHCDAITVKGRSHGPPIFALGGTRKSQCDWSRCGPRPRQPWPRAQTTGPPETHP